MDVHEQRHLRVQPRRLILALRALEIGNWRRRRRRQGLRRKGSVGDSGRRRGPAPLPRLGCQPRRCAPARRARRRAAVFENGPRSRCGFEKGPRSRFSRRALAADFSRRALAAGAPNRIVQVVSSGGLVAGETRCHGRRVTVIADHGTKRRANAAQAAHRPPRPLPPLPRLPRRTEPPCLPDSLAAVNRRYNVGIRKNIRQHYMDVPTMLKASDRNEHDSSSCFSLITNKKSASIRNETHY